MKKEDNIIYKIRLENNMTQRDFSKKIGISQTQLSFLENNRRNASPKVIINISNIFKVKKEDLFNFFYENKLQNVILKY